jgi:superfamily II DNA or RNA helicase
MSVTKHSSSTEKLVLFKSYFRGRADVYARHWNNSKKDIQGYVPVLDKNRHPISLTDVVLLQHFLGQELIGFYPLLSDNTTHILAIDFDEKDWKTDTKKVVELTKLHNIDCLLERSKSGNGAHVWFFFEQNISAFKARQFGKCIINKAKISSKSSFDRLFPSQDQHSGKGYGNLIAFPLNGKHIKDGNTAFIDPDGNQFDDQWVQLESCKKISEDTVNKIIADNNKNSTSIIEKPNAEETEPQVQTTETTIVKIKIGSQIAIPMTSLPDSLYRFLRQRLNFANPQYYELERKGYSTWQTPKYIKTLEVANNEILIPAGFLDEIQRFAIEHNLTLDIDDKRTILKDKSIANTIILKPEQLKVAKELLQHARVVLEAPPGFGKTIVALHCVCRRKQPTLIIVHTKTLISQWQKAIEQWLGLDKKAIGKIGDNRWKIKTPITIASYQTLARRSVEEIKDKFGMVVVDECHHVPAHTFTKVLKNLPCKYALGLTATPYRKDKLEKLMSFYVGPTVKASKPETITTSEEKPTVKTTVLIKHTNFQINTKKKIEFNALGDSLITNSERNQQIVSDVATALRSGQKCLVLTERIEHCVILLELIRQQIKGIHAAIATGKMGKKERENMAKRIKQERFQLLITTGKLVGEGFDWPELTHLFLAFPVSWKGRLIQYLGRIQRNAENKTDAFVYDYVDYEVKMLQLMYFKRLRVYRELNLVSKKARPKKTIQNINQMSLI